MTIRKFVSGAVFALFIASPAAAQDYPKMNLKLAHFVPSTVVASQVDQWFADEIEKRSGGNITIKIFWSETMGKANELLELLRSGAVDLVAVSPAFFPSEIPLTGATNSLMMQFWDGKTASTVTTELVRNIEEIQEELERNNIYPIFFHTLNPYRPFCTSKIETIEDFKGKKMRSYGEYIPQMWDELGAIGVNVMPNEVYESLHRGTLDCAFYANDLIQATKQYEVAKYTWAGDDSFGAIPTWPIWVNWQVWHEKWRDHVRELFETVGAEAMVRDIEMSAKAEQDSVDWMVAEHGVTVVDFKDMDKLRETVTDPAELWLAKMHRSGLGDGAQRKVA
jgi:TRAP-type C4-dicarboxylate transport system substrate-binding protein